MAIGERIKRIRTFRKMTQSQLGEAVGLSDVRIRQYELGNRTPKADMIQQMANALDLTIAPLRNLLSMLLKMSCLLFLNWMSITICLCMKSKIRKTKAKNISA